MISVKVLKTGTKTKAMTTDLGNGQIEVSNQELASIIKYNKHEDVEFIARNTGEDVTHASLVNVLKTTEKTHIDSGIDLARVIRAGGFSKYIEQLETRIK